MNVNLTQKIRELEDEWIEEHKGLAQSRNVESQLIYAQFLLTGAGSTPKNVKRGLQYLKLASRKSAEACLKLGKLYLKGTKTRQSDKKAYFYLRVATLFKCRCGSYAEQYHSKTVSNPHICYPTEATEYLSQVQNSYEDYFKEHFNSWRRG